MKILACLSFAHHPSSDKIVPSSNDLQAALMAKQLATQTEPPILLHLCKQGANNSQQQEEVLREYACYGFDSIEWAETNDIPTALVAYVRRLEPDYIFFGINSGGFDSPATGLLPYLVAVQMGSVVTDRIVNIQNQQAVQYLPSGSRRNLELPAFGIITVHPQANITAPYVYSHGRQAQIRKVSIAVPKDEETSKAPQWQVEQRTKFHPRISIASDTDGINRMRKAIEVDGKGGKVISGGSARDHAKQIIAILREKQLIAKLSTADSSSKKI